MGVLFGFVVVSECVCESSREDTKFNSSLVAPDRGGRSFSRRPPNCCFPIQLNSTNSQNANATTRTNWRLSSPIIIAVITVLRWASFTQLARQRQGDSLCHRVFESRRSGQFETSLATKSRSIAIASSGLPHLAESPSAGRQCRETGTSS